METKKKRTHAHSIGNQPITLTTNRRNLINVVSRIADTNGYLFAPHEGHPVGCIHEQMVFDLIPVDGDYDVVKDDAWFFAVSLEEAFIIMAKVDRDTPAPKPVIQVENIAEVMNYDA